VQEHIAFKVWPLVAEWEMPKKSNASSSEGGLVYLKYTYRYRSQFGEPDDEWLEAIEQIVTSFWELIPRMKTKLRIPPLMPEGRED
jgi:hypothetical protein